jgi:hypothetical protein
MFRFKLTLIFLFSFLIVAGQQSPDLFIKEQQTIVVAGEEYNGLLYLINCNFEEVEYYIHSRLLEKDSLGAGMIKFRGSAGAYDKNGKVNKTFTVSAKYIENKEVRTISKKFTYIVMRPTILVSSAVRGVLYKNCGNEITVKCPDIGNSFNPTYSADGATIINSSEIGLMTILPVDELAYLTVSIRGDKVAVEKFISANPPSPNILILSDSIEIDIDKPISSKGRLSIKIIPEPSFANNYPYDARYKIGSWSITILRNNKELLVKTFNDADVDMSSLGIKLLSGDYLIFNIKEVNRINFLNETKTENNINRKYIARIL